MLWEQLLDSGVAAVPAPLPKGAWQELYSAFDEFVGSLPKDSEERDLYNQYAKEWQALGGLRDTYGGYFSPYFRDTSGVEGRDNKRIIQLCAPYYKYLHDRDAVLLRNDRFRRLLDKMMAALLTSYSSIIGPIAELEAVEPDFVRALHPRGELPPVVIRLLSYGRDDQLSTNPHVDKSAITVILDSDDTDTNPRLVFGDANAHGVQRLSSFTPFLKGPDESIVFFGAAPSQAGYERLRPAPHAVRPFLEPTRHSAIFFWLLPDFDMHDFDTTIVVDDDLMLARKMRRK
jgi:hypothetical protein